MPEPNVSSVACAPRVRHGTPSRVAGVRLGRCAALLLLLAASADPIAARAGTCGAAGGAPTGPSSAVCDYLDEATGRRTPGPDTGVGNPIDLVTGNRYRRDIDLRIGGRAALVFARHYNSLNRHAGPLGVGWSHTFETRLAPTRPDHQGAVQLVQGDGRRLVFERDPAQPRRWRTHDLSDGVLTRGPGRHSDRWHWDWGGGRLLHFDAAGRLLRIDQDGVPMLRLHRTPSGRLSRVDAVERWHLTFEYVTHPLGERLARVAAGEETVAQLDYDEAGQLASVTWPDGRQRRYLYEAPDDPLRLTGVLEAESGSDTAPVRVARYGYDPQGRATETETPQTGPLQVTYALPSRVGEPGTTTVTDREGRTARYRWTYDARRHRARVLDAQGQACLDCPPSPRRYGWDGSGRLERIEQGTQALALERDSKGRVRAATLESPSGRQWLWRIGYLDTGSGLDWHWLEQPSVAPGRRHRITLSRDALGRVTQVTERGYAPIPLGGGRTGWQPIVRRFGLGHVGGQRPNVAVADWVRPRLTGLSWVDGPRPGPVDRVTVTANDNRLTLSHPLGFRQILHFEEEVLRRIEDDRGGEVVFTPHARDEVWLGGPRPSSAYGGGRLIEFDYAAFGRLDRVTRTHFKARESLTVNRGDPEPQAFAMVALGHWRGRPTAIALADGSVFQRGFDDFGRVAWIEEPGQPRQWARYDEDDRLVARILADGTTVRHRRDASGRLLETSRQTAAGHTLIGRYRWDGADLVEASNDVVSVRYGWDRLGRLESAEHRFADAPAMPLRWQWQHDLAGRIVEERLPDGTVVHYRYRDRTVTGVEIRLAAAPSVDLDADTLQTEQAFEESPPGSRQPAPEDARWEGGWLVRAAEVRHLAGPHGLRTAKRSVDPAHADRDRAFVHHDWRMRAERDARGTWRHLIWAEDRPIALIDGPRVLRIVTDQRRAPVRMLDAQGRTLWSARYSRAGAARVSADPQVTALALRLPGQYEDAETGWHHNHWRTYAPEQGRYLETDPLGLQPDFVGLRSLTDYGGGDPVTRYDPWGLATLTFHLIGTGANGQPLGRSAQGFDRARWSLMIEDIQPVPLYGRGRSAPQPAGIDGLLFDPWGDFIGGRDDPGLPLGNGIDALAWPGSPAAGPTGRAVFNAFATHYGGALASPERFVVRGFDDRRAGALALILAASPSARQQCVATALGALPGLEAGWGDRVLRPGDARNVEPARVSACSVATALPVPYRDDIERQRVERLQLATEIQESPQGAIRADCTRDDGCRSRTAVRINGRTYWASYGRTQFTVTTFLAQLRTMAQPSGGPDAAALRATLGLDAPIVLNGRDATIADALALASRRVDATYRIWPQLRGEFGSGLDAQHAHALWQGLPAARRSEFTDRTGMGEQGFVDLLGYRPAGGALTEEEGRHAVAAAAAATVGWTDTTGTLVGFRSWMVALFASGAPYDYVSRRFLRDNLRRIVDDPRLAPAFVNAETPQTAAWLERQHAIERDLARRVGVLHNAGNLPLAVDPNLSGWLQRNPDNWITRYVEQLTALDTRGNWEALRCVEGLAAGTALELRPLRAMPAPAAVPPRPAAAR